MRNEEQTSPSFGPRGHIGRPDRTNQRPQKRPKLLPPRETSSHAQSCRSKKTKRRKAACASRGEHDVTGKQVGVVATLIWCIAAGCAAVLSRVPRSPSASHWVFSKSAMRHRLGRSRGYPGCSSRLGPGNSHRDALTKIKIRGLFSRLSNRL
jgi:hypothetical protein